MIEFEYVFEKALCGLRLLHSIFPRCMELVEKIFFDLIEIIIQMFHSKILDILLSLLSRHIHSPVTLSAHKDDPN